MKIEAVLFDLDNTLILFDENEFFKVYSQKLYNSFKDILTPDEFGKKLWQSTSVMINNNGKVNNAEYFMNDFAQGINEDKHKLWQRFEGFYSTKFEQLQPLMTPISGVQELLHELKELGLKLVIATNPMFPMEVQQLRIKWAGLKDIEFDLITHAHNSTYCKPNPNYYLEVCEKIKVKPKDCIMVGNDALNDIIAGEIGMKTFLTTDGEKYKIDISREMAAKSETELLTPDYKGKLSELLSVIKP